MKLCTTITDKRIKTTYQTLEKTFNEVHNNFYSYEKAVFKGMLEKVIITCPIHGDFTQKPNNHKRGEGCRKCGYLNRKHNKFSTKKYSDRVEKLHKNIKILKYKGLFEEVEGICSIHDKFTCNARTLLMQRGNCPKCSKKHRRTEKEFIEDAKKLHNSLYSYVNCNYVNMNTKINIVCKKHGIFTQTPASHINSKNGCPLCAEEKKGYSIDKPGRLYYLKVTRNNHTFYKIGITNNTVKRRYDSETKVKYEVIYEEYYKNGEIPLIIEQQIKNTYQIQIVYKTIKVFDRTGNTEVFYTDVLNLDKGAINVIDNW